ncbi:transposase IS4 family protein [Caldithrix abyssi DSM 13497]|uniref:Transposase n=1 Tax=Caldithrix abyssi DSM 13497 TaxID=880073 RepID=H1XYK7_CALAY|nr:IS1182 family transposase [Caldithrix abyssi]APF19713.1 Transposase [Caldithrix abyssi DSM 13497]EHO39825.1 transposase IS4 family protein [Caldithrix abyssi DSM 13497]
MKPKSCRKIPFKTTDQNQLTILPPSLDELIEPNHMVRFINAIIDKMDIDFLIKEYKGGGRAAYHPRMLLKVVIYAYTQKIFTSRQIAKALRENIHFMWLSGNSRPDFRTINRFRSSRLKGKIEEVFTYVVEQLLELGYIELNDLFIDGSKFQANANKYKAVWKKNVDRYQRVLQEKLKELLKKIDNENDLENRLYGNKDLGELGEDVTLSSHQIEQIVDILNERLKKEPDNKELKRAKNKIEKDYLPRQRKYEKQRKLLNGRNSYSQTDPDATFMSKKRDHHNNTDLLPSYNVQVGSENQFIVNYTINQNANDSVLLKPFMESYKRCYGRQPNRVIGDAGYGSEENYAYLESEGVEAYIKYSSYYKEQKKSYKENPFLIDNMRYDPELDRYECPAGRYLEYVGEQENVTSTGFKVKHRIYRSESCEGCALKEKCYKGQTARVVRVNVMLNDYKKQVRSRLNTEEGRKLISKRGSEIETIFGQIKHNLGIRGFLLRGLEKVKTEFGIIAVAYNLKKMFNQMKEYGLVNEMYKYSANIFFNLNRASQCQNLGLKNTILETLERFFIEIKEKIVIKYSSCLFNAKICFV